ncbi:MAG: DUF938 domain-containing protein [Polyangiaceae bacterium]|nr:DUF938 domain-containing protein [Polyangiaceae bacterium]
MKAFSEAAARNSRPIGEALLELLPRGARVLELASGSGQHAHYLSQLLPEVVWQPSDPSPEALASIECYRAESHPARLLKPLQLDAAAAPWGLQALDAVVCINMVHISPWEASRGLFHGAASALAETGALITYGPYRFDGVFLAESNREFDQSLRRRNPLWGVRDVTDLKRLAAEAGLSLSEQRALPANNHLLVWRRTAK